MNILYLIFFLIIFCQSNSQIYPHVSRLFVQDGNLVFTAAYGKNISFKTVSSAGISINDVDLLSTLNKAHNATKLLENYQNTYASTVDRIDTLEQRMFDIPTRISNTSGVSVSYLPIRRLRRSLNILSRRVTDLETAILQDDCVGNPCNNGGVCQDMFKGYICHCSSGWQGSNCSEDINECSRFMGTDLGCQNGAVCINKPGSYECVCTTGFFGIHCTRRKADCTTGGQELCDHGTCVHQNNNIGYKCICDQGWTTDGTSPACSVDVNECNRNIPSCSVNPKVTCINVPGSFYCGSCPRGYTGNGYYCADIDECEINNGGCSTYPMVTCQNTQGSRMCGACPPGYEGDGVICTYKGGVCNVNNGGCHYLAQCRGNPRISSTYVECTCPPGYIGNGIGPYGCTLSANPSNPCASNPCVNGVCSVSNATGNYVCSCRGNYVGRNCDIRSRDLCDPNPCSNGGTCRSIGGLAFQCVCKSGFRGRLCETQLQGCGGKLYGVTGVLKYPPGDYETYGHSLSCAWTIQTNSSKVLNITFSKFDVEESPGCRSDWLQIHDGPTSASHPLGRFCGNKLPLGGKILSTHNVIYLWFRSNVGIANTGFQLSWNSTEPECGGIISAISHGTIQSPGSPGNYPPNRDCIWIVTVPFYKRAQFQFFSLNIGNNPDCSKDFIEFRSPSFRHGFTFAKFCNSSNPAPFYSVSTYTEIHFHSSESSSHPGFQMTYNVLEETPGCGGIFTADQGTIKSTKTGSSVRNWIPHVCEYQIQKRLDFRTKITFLKLDLTESTTCGDEYVEVRDGPSTDSPLVGRYCGKNLPESYVSSGQITISSLILKDTSEWEIKYERVCGTKYTNASGYFDSTGGAKDCVYQIEQPQGKVITLTIKVAAKFTTRACHEYIEIRDGDNENAPLIKKMCEDGTETITSTYNHLWIRYIGTYFRRITFEATYTSTEIGCGGILRNKMGNIASPSRPGGYYPPSMKCTWVIIAPPKSVIRISWITFNIEESYECSYDRIQVYDNNTDLGMGGQIGKFCGYTLPPTLTSSGNIMTIVFTTDVTINLDGFLATYVTVSEASVCGGNYYTSAGVMKTPNYPNEYPTNKDCVWTIMVPAGQQILLNISDFNLEQYINCRYDFLEIRNGGTSHSPLIGKYCGDKIPKQIPSHTNKLYLRFVSDQNKAGRGFKINWSSTATGCGGTLTSSTGTIISPNYPEPYDRNTDCTWKITVSKGSRINVMFSDIDLEQNSPCNNQYSPDYVELFDGQAINSKSLGKFCSKGDKPIESSSNQILVKFRTDIAFNGRGFQLHYSSICNNTFTGFRGVIESPNFPNEYPQDLNCVWRIIVSNKNKINITFSHFDLEVSSNFNNQSCMSDYLEVKYGETLEEDEEGEPLYKTQGKYCGTKNPGLINLDGDHAELHFVSDKWIVGTGFSLEWQLFGCGGILKRNSGTIQSPNYPKPYPSSIKCEWQIEVDFGYSIQIEFHEIDIEKDSCNYDWIKIYNGPNNSSNEIATLCHKVKPIVLSSTGNQMFIQFQSDYSYEGKGFIANYSKVATKCGGKFTAPEGNIHSPNYPNNYDKNDTCYWFIEVEDNHQVELTFEDVDLPKNCDQAYIKVYNGPTEAYPVLKKICDVMPNDTIKSTFNEMYIEFRAADRLYTTKGFSAKYKKSCGSRIVTEGSGSIEVTYFEFTQYTPCTWTIVAKDPSRHITLTITQMQIYSLYDCDDEDGPVSLYSGETTDSPLLKSFCAEKIPPPIVTDGSAITIQLTQNMNFFATYSVLDSHCGGTLKSTKGFFATPGYPKKYPIDMQCEWTIEVAPGNHISLNFIEFDILYSEKCNTDFLEIRKNNVSGSLLGVYCGKNKPLNLTHEGNLWMMYKSGKVDAGETITAKGFYGEYELNNNNELTGSHGTIGSPLYPQDYYNYGTFSWKITVTSRKIILLTFKEFYVESYNGDCYSAVFTVYDGVDETAPELLNTCGNELPAPIKSNTNIVFIKIEYNYIRMGTKFLLEWLEINKSPALPPHGKENLNKGCGSSEVININAVGSYIVKSPGYPHGYAGNLQCEWIFSTIDMNHLMVDIRTIDFREYSVYRRRLSCLEDYISLYQKRSDDNDWQLIKRVCNREDQTSFSASNLLKVQFVTNRYLNGTGFEAVVTERCGGSMKGPNGLIYFNKTTVWSSCSWNVTVRSGKTIRITFEEMDIARDGTKGCDSYIMLRNGKYPDSPLLGNGKYCGTDIPDPLNTTGNYLHVTYEGSQKIKGFKLKYEEISVECGGEIILSPLENSTEVHSPNYPNIPLPHSECFWLIRAPSEELLRIDFEEQFDLTIRTQCDIEYVEVRDGGTELSPLIGRYCKEVPHTQFTTGNVMFIKFFTNTENPRNGFKAKISLGYCGGTVRGDQGEITSPLQQSKEPTRNCTWHIIGPTDRYLNLKFEELKLHGTSVFRNNKITIFETNRLFNNVTKLGQFTGTVLPPPLITSSNEAIINYIGTNNDRFRLKFNASQSECGGIINAESGTITSPGYPIMNHLNRYCEWTIEVPEGRRITIVFEDFDLDEAVLYDQSIAVLDGFAPFKIPIAYLQPGATKRVFETSSNKLMVIFWSNRPSTHRGFKATFTSNKPTICSSDFSGDSGVLKQPSARNYSYSCHWKHTTHNTDFPNQTLALKIDAEVNTTKKGTSFSCSYSPWSIIVTNQEKMNVLASLCKLSIKNYIVRSPFRITEISAIAKQQMNFTISYNTYDCGGIVFSQDGFITSPNYPNKPSQSFECAWLIKTYSGQTINLTMISMDLGNDCDKHFITINNGGSPLHPKIGKYCKNDKPGVIISQGSNLWMEYRYETGSAGTGFKLKYEAKSESCGGIYHDKTRTIQTPNYGKDYPNNAECLWEIRSNPGYSIGLQFIDRFYIEESDNCVNDYIEVWDWQDDKWISIAKKCGRNIPTGIQSTGDKLKILFRSNNKTTASGFKVKWNWLCGGTFEASKIPRTIVSPGYPMIYSSNLNCKYNITTKAEIISVSFEDFELENGANCIYDNVTFTGRYPVYSAFSTIYCGTRKPPPVRMQNYVIINFRTDKWVNRRGFKFTYRDESCGGNIKEPTVIQGPLINYQSTDLRYYLPRINCIWNITAPHNQVVILRILSMVLPEMCFNRGLLIYSSLTDSNKNRLATLCGNITDNEQPIHSDSGQMLVKLDTSTYHYKSFSAEVYFSHGPAEGCGGTVNLTDTKYIKAPDLEDLDCGWKIVAPRDYQVQIQFTEINIPVACTKNSTKQNWCSCSFIEVRDGGGPLSELIQRLCSTSTRQGPEYRKITTSSNYGFIRFVLTGRQSNAFKVTLTPVISKCGPSVLNATREVQYITSPGYPNNYPSDIKCSWFISTQNLGDKIELHFVEFNLTGNRQNYDAYNLCDDDKLEIAEDPNQKIITEGFGPQSVYNVAKRRTIFLNYNLVAGQHAFCGAEESPFDYYSIGRSLTLTFRSVVTSETSKGFKLEYRIAGCNRNYTSLQGRLYSSNHKSDCILTITVPENRTISLYFQRLMMPYNVNCVTSGFEVRDGGPNGTLLSKSCGLRSPDPVFSYSNKLYIHVFNKQNPSYTMSYDVGYTSTTAGRGCGGDLYNYKGWVSSPLYPNEFRNNTVCRWTIGVPLGLHVTLKFVNFDLQGSCEQTNVVVHTFTSHSITMHRFCKEDRPAILRSNNRMEVIFQSSVHNGGRGWLAVFQGLEDDSMDVL